MLNSQDDWFQSEPPLPLPLPEGNEEQTPIFFDNVFQINTQQTFESIAFDNGLQTQQTNEQSVISQFTTDGEDDEEEQEERLCNDLNSVIESIHSKNGSIQNDGFQREGASQIKEFDSDIEEDKVDNNVLLDENDELPPFISNNEITIRPIEFKLPHTIPMPQLPAFRHPERKEKENRLIQLNGLADFAFGVIEQEKEKFAEWESDINLKGIDYYKRRER
jgi:hypothetical protein